MLSKYCISRNYQKSGCNADACALAFKPLCGGYVLETGMKSELAKRGPHIGKIELHSMPPPVTSYFWTIDHIFWGMILTKKLYNTGTTEYKFILEDKLIIIIADNKTYSVLTSTKLLSRPSIYGGGAVVGRLL